MLGEIVHPNSNEGQNRNMSSELSWPSWAKSANLYEVNIRQYTPEGTFEAFRKHLPRLNDMGVDILWFMPIFPISNTKKKGSLGSYYAVSNYMDTNPNFGTLKDFKKVIDEAHKFGMKVILDWVPNHTGWDHNWIKTNPAYYSQDSMGQIVDPLDENGKSIGWDDVADLNYDNQEMRRSMINNMLFWIEKYDIDGFRQDMALLVPLDFWKETVKLLLQAKSDLFLLAESEVHDHINQYCFNAIYSWSFHHLMNAIALGTKNVVDIDKWYENERRLIYQGAYMFFTSNHDENSWSGSEIERMGEAHKAFAVLINTLDGIALTYGGQEEPMPRRLAFFEKDDIEFRHFAYAEFYKTLNAVKHRQPALWNAEYGGKVARIMDHEHIFSFERVKEDSKITVLINLSKIKQTVVCDRPIYGNEIFSNQEIHFKTRDEISLLPWHYLVIENSK